MLERNRELHKCIWLVTPTLVHNIIIFCCPWHRTHSEQNVRQSVSLSSQSAFLTARRHSAMKAFEGWPEPADKQESIKPNEMFWPKHIHNQKYISTMRLCR